MSESMDDLARQCGFEDEAEMLRLVAAADLTAPGAIAAFQQWKRDDGTKAGLLKIGEARP